MAIADLGVLLEPDQACDAMLFGEALKHTIFVLPNPADEVTRHTEIERSVALAREEIDKAGSRSRHQKAQGAEGGAACQ